MKGFTVHVATALAVAFYGDGQRRRKTSFCFLLGVWESSYLARGR